MRESDVFDRLVPLLAVAIPDAVASRRITEQICRLRVYYYDTHAPCTYLLLKPATAEWRTRLLAKRGDSAGAYYWMSGEDGGDLPDIQLMGPEPISDLFSKVYELLCEDEVKYMIPFREALQRVCYELNGKDWRNVCLVTDDFVVVPADGSMHFANDSPDIVRSVPQHRLDLLRSRELGPPENLGA